MAVRQAEKKRCKRKAALTRSDFRHKAETGRVSVNAPYLHMGMLAKAIGIGQSHLSHIIGQTRNPSMKVLERLAKVLGESVDRVIERIKDKDWLL